MAIICVPTSTCALPDANSSMMRSPSDEPLGGVAVPADDGGAGERLLHLLDHGLSPDPVEAEPAVEAPAALLRAAPAPAAVVAYQPVRALVKR